MISYNVTATLSGRESLEEYTSWLRSGHIQQVVEEGGASNGSFTVLDSPEGAIQVVSRFMFPDRAAYDRYQAEVAPRLQPEGKRLFVDTQKVLRFERAVGELQFEYEPNFQFSVTEITPYLYFNGSCREAMGFYEICLGGSLEIMTHDETSALPGIARPSVMHSTLQLSSAANARLMASDATSAVTVGDQAGICLSCPSQDDMKAVYQKLTHGANVYQALDETDEDAFAMLKDKFGVFWLLTVNPSVAYRAVLPFLRFNGDCEPRMGKLRGIFGGNYSVTEHIGTEQQVGHSVLTFNNGRCTVIGADVSDPCPPATQGSSVAVSLLFNDAAKVAPAYARLRSDGGCVVEPLERQFWGGLFGQCEDRHGQRWMCVGPHGDTAEGSAADACSSLVDDGSGEQQSKRAKVA